VIFENGIPVIGNDTLFFLELGFVEVSSDGLNYVRFPSRSRTDTTVQLGNGDGMDPRNIHNLAGNFLYGYGTPFDLDDVQDSAGLNMDSIVWVRVRDVTGFMDTVTASRDATGWPVNDPWPTEFPTGGFDLDAVGAIYQLPPNGIAESGPGAVPLLYPMPVPRGGIVHINWHNNATWELRDLTDVRGKSHKSKVDMNGNRLYFGELAPGIYYLNLQNASQCTSLRIAIQ
jgi:hypothetical protein